MPIAMGGKLKRDAFDGLYEILRRIEKPSTQNLDRVEMSVRAGFADNFLRETRGGGPPWAALAPRTQRERARQGYGASGPILVRSGAYRRTWTERFGWRLMIYRQGGWNMFVSSDHRNAFELELGVRSRNLPARNVRYLDDGSVRRVESAMYLLVDSVINSVRP